MANAKGHTTLRIGVNGEAKEYRLRLGFSEIADADEFLGRSLIQSMQEDPSNFHYIRTAFYFAVRENASDIRSVKQAGKVLENADGFEEVGRALFDAIKASGLIDEDPVDKGAAGNSAPLT